MRYKQKCKVVSLNLAHPVYAFCLSSGRYDKIEAVLFVMHYTSY